MLEIPTFLINLDGSTERLQSATAQLDTAGIAFERVPAFDGRNLSRAEFPDYDHAAAMYYMGRGMNGGEIGIYISHIRAAQRFLDSDAPFGLVFEDDVSLVPGAEGALAETVRWIRELRNDWDILHFGPRKHFLYTPLHRFHSDGKSYQIDMAHYFPMAAHAFLWSRTGAMEFIKNYSEIRMPVDNQIQHWQVRRGRGLSIWPPLAVPSGVQSIIDQGPERREKTSRHPFYGLRKQRRLWVNKAHALRHKLAARHRLP